MNDFIDGRALVASLLGTSCKPRTANRKLILSPSGAPCL